MASYMVGTISTTAGSNVVTGTDTQWLANAAAGSEIIIGDCPTAFTIAAVDSETQLTLNANFPYTYNDEDYIIVNDFTQFAHLLLLNIGDLHSPDIISRNLKLIDDFMSSAYVQIQRLCFMFDGLVEIPGSGNTSRTQKEMIVDGSTETLQVYRVEAISAGNLHGTTGNTTITIADHPFGGTGAEITLDIPYNSGKAYQVSDTLTVLSGSTLYAWVSDDTGQHENLQIMLSVRSI